MRILLLLAITLGITGCASTNTPTGHAIAAGLQQQAAARSVGAAAAPQRTGMQEFFSTGGTAR